jgi:uncharacterized membrane protein YqjE
MKETVHVTGERDKPVGELMRQLAQETSTLVRQELALAKAEMREKGAKAGVGAGMFGGASVIGLLALASLTLCFIAALHLILPLWLAALIVALVYGAIAGALAITGKTRIQEAVPPAPQQTIQTVKEDVEWAKMSARSGRT